MSKVFPAWNAGLWDVAWTSAAVAATLGTLCARQAALPENRFRWTLWTAAAAFWLAGQIGWNVFGITGFPQSPNVADVCWWSFAVLVVLSLRNKRSSSRSVHVVALVEVVPLIAAAVALSVAELWHDAAVSAQPIAPRLSDMVYPAVYVAAAVVMLQATISGSLRMKRKAPSRFVLAGMAAQAVAFSFWSTQLLAGTYVPGATLVDPLFVLGLLAMSVGGVLAGRVPEDGADPNETAKHGVALPALMFVLLLAANVQAEITNAASGAEIVLRIGLVFASAGLIVRGILLERRLRELLGRERAAMSVLADREAEMARLNAQLEEDSRRDPLTGMRNRRALADDLAKLEANYKEQGREFVLALCDVDHFKAYNDRMGHLAGDQALRVIAAKIRSAMRPGDVAYRFGGEELLVILQELDGAAALSVAERIRLSVQEADLQHPDGIDGRVTITIGVAVGGGSSSELIARADAALYDAKRAGRNRVLVAADDAPSFAAGRRHRVVEEVVPRHLLSMLAVSREAASGHGEQAILEALARTIRSELSFQVVAVNVLDDAQSQFTCTVVLGDDDARDTLLGLSAPWAEMEGLMARPEFQRMGALWVPAGSYEWQDDEFMWTPATEAVPGADGWDPEDLLMLPIRAHDGTILGAVSVDQPVSGLRPDDSHLALLMAVTDHAGLALEQSRRDSEHAAAVAEQSTELRLAAVMLLAETLDLRDSGTARHSRTVGELARQTALALELAPERVEQVHAAGVLHDLGKLGIADAILYKPGGLEEHEWREIQRHPEIGERILKHAGLQEIAGWVRSHHERVDGSGYPDRLVGHQIALEARILAVADAYEAMTADRPYRQGVSPAAAREELLRCSGSQFDPMVVEAFINTLSDPDAALESVAA
ncbi:MAG TPA: diguanylate cyclase [Solirubrobacteraceae bacterium]|nr:diguanylate cyclase [Solirubrobacteraceae bacterium]